MRQLTPLIALAPLLLASPASAHFGLMECWFEQDRSQIHCQTGWTDGGAASNYDIHLYDYDDNLLAIERTDDQSRVQFPAPDGEFYLVFDPGHESPVEVDVVEMKDR
ncbi:hypothetical protein [Ferrimonas balearica]|uniref:hypothetical protein n=1 Tax=Ferrimonas balearica TaxID=44012 RepID=UPI001C9994F6|nr:hypothetical protein [Ferrimonas balearica]MBY5991483.1 hypothetical protein [Ferrimonas balearica]